MSSTLQSAPVAPLLERLFAEAEAAEPKMLATFSALSEAERDKLLKDRNSYRAVYHNLKDFALPVSRDTGTLLYTLARSIGAKSIVEFGMSFGLSTLHLAAALKDNGGGKLITTEFESSKVAVGRQNLEEGGLLSLVEIREGDALETLASNLPSTIDMVLLDGAKALYSDILALLGRHLRPGSLILADNADLCPEYIAEVRAAGGPWLSAPLAGEVELTMRL